MAEETSTRLIMLAVMAVIGLLVTIIVNWDKIYENLNRLKRSVCKSDEDKRKDKISLLKGYLIHYGYDFDNGKSRYWFTLADVLTDNHDSKVMEWVSDHYDEAINSLITDGYIERVDEGVGIGVKLSSEGRHHYTSRLKANIGELISELENAIKA
jgi:hypothetical protein